MTGASIRPVRHEARPGSVAGEAERLPQAPGVAADEAQRRPLVLPRRAIPVGREVEADGRRGLQQRGEGDPCGTGALGAPRPTRRDGVGRGRRAPGGRRRRGVGLPRGREDSRRGCACRRRRAPDAASARTNGPVGSRAPSPSGRGERRAGSGGSGPGAKHPCCAARRGRRRAGDGARPRTRAAGRSLPPRDACAAPRARVPAARAARGSGRPARRRPARTASSGGGVRPRRCRSCAPGCLRTPGVRGGRASPARRRADATGRGARPG